MVTESGITTTVQEVVGPYEGRRIARTSNDVVDVIVSRHYVYDECEIYVDNIEAQQDRATGRIYVPGPLALEINRLVEGVLASAHAPHTGDDSTPHVVRLDAPRRHAA